MEKIIKDYYLRPGSILVKHQIGTNGVDCWFDMKDTKLRSKVHIQHRCIDFADFMRTFTTLKTPEQDNGLAKGQVITSKGNIRYDEFDDEGYM